MVAFVSVYINHSDGNVITSTLLKLPSSLPSKAERTSTSRNMNFKNIILLCVIFSQMMTYGCSPLEEHGEKFCFFVLHAVLESFNLQ